MAKKTKKEKYLEYGIQYRNDDNKIYCDPLGIWIPLLLPVGSNTKVGNAATWSIYHGNEILNIKDFIEKYPKTAGIMETAGISTIKASCPLHCKDCYCDNGNYRYDSTKAANMLKLILATYYCEWLKNAIIAQINVEEIKQVRIHAAGDFFSNEYIELWVYVATTCKEVIFWTYTKNQDALEAFENVLNLFIVPSLTPFGFNFGTCKELIYRYNKLTAMGYRVHICACGTEYQTHCSECNSGCKVVGKECDFVLFIKHSCKDYKAGKNDPEEFAIICGIIAKQKNS